MRSNHSTYLAIGFTLEVISRLLAILDTLVALCVASFVVLVGMGYVVAGVALWAAKKRRHKAWGALGVLGPIGALLFAMVPRRRSAEGEVEIEPEGPPLLRPLIVVSGALATIAVLWVSVGSALAWLAFRYELRTWNAAFPPRARLSRNAAAADLERASRAVGIDFAAKSTRLPGVRAIVYAVASSESDAPVAHVDALDAVAPPAAVDDVATQALRMPTWSGEIKNEISGAWNVHRVLLASAVASHQRGDGRDARYLAAAKAIRQSMGRSGGLSALLAMSAAELETAVVRKARLRAESPPDPKVTSGDYVKGEVDFVIAGTNDAGGFLDDDPLLVRPFIDPYFSFSRAQYLRSWRHVLEQPSGKCREIPSPSFSRWNFFARIAAPEPQGVERFNRASLAQELTALVDAERHSPGVQGERSVRSTVCSDVTWRVINSADGFSVSIDREFVMKKAPVYPLALRYREARVQEQSQPRTSASTAKR